ncbi:HlyD family type I secretion periplasmic adaptor subunit [Bradyrhizobium jicamae]|uniref:Membrane fusion protein (MFP) family protein n=1 Tax=Bradyrhizobium jicamae TaxID=280332 RepID=A0ABS5FXV6_9BRAD|nr:HlyD family type I secretion periplasmic adaptor subunit [Bradyrhizobium jicamae]MBR0801660.1 HlyD family type I secretion periplasmic adaptor subunit [Bradyrhizobium jicamae]MBR0935113.1 HlyD family type I secretion periplasmic adaptor subunit [Bradyrhizobium jicamae]
MKSANKIIPLPSRPVPRDKEELEFLPAALEIVETPPSPIGRAIAATVIAVFCVALSWACWGKIDIVASAPGKIVPSGRSKVVQPFETGVVHAIHVHDGSNVKAGDVLIELDPTMNGAEREHVQSDLTATRLDIARLRALTSDGDPIAAFSPPQDAAPDLTAVQRKFLQNQIAEHKAKLASLDAQQAQKEAERATIIATINKIGAMIPVIQERVDIRKALLKSEYGSKLQYFQELQSLVEQQQELEIQKSHDHEAEAAIASIAASRAQAVSEYRHTLYDELAKAEQKAAGLAQDLVKAEQKTRLQSLTAPIDGVVQQLAVHTVGGVVTPGQSLLVVVPTDSPLEIEAMVSNRDIGFVYVGQPTEIKVDTFNFTRYGLLHGTVLSLSKDAISRDLQQDKDTESKPPTSTDSSSSEPRGRELVYSARVSLDRTQMQVEDKMVDLSPGMAVTVEIETGSRRVISYLLSPLLKYKQESLRER